MPQKGAKTSNAMNDLELNIDNIMDNIENGLKFQDKNLSSILDSEKSMQIAIKAQHKKYSVFFRECLNRH